MSKHLDVLLRRVEAAEQRHMKRAWRPVRRIWQDGKIIGGYDGPLSV